MAAGCRGGYATKVFAVVRFFLTELINRITEMLMDVYQNC